MATSEATKDVEADIYGQLHPVESDALIVEKLQEFAEEVKKLPEETKQSLLQAEEKCPELVTDKFKLIFLRSEVFNADVSVTLSFLRNPTPPLAGGARHFMLPTRA